MADPHVITALVAKRSELSGLVEDYQKEIARINGEIKTLDAAIKIFDSEYDLGTVKAKAYRRKNSFFKARQANTLILDVLREATEPLSTVEVANRVADKKGLDKTAIDLKALRATIATTLRGQRSKGLVQEVGLADDGHTRLWRLGP